MTVIQATLSTVIPIGADNPLIGWHNLTETRAVTATSEQPDFPVSNLQNPSTILIWKAATSATQTITVDVSGEYEGVDYVAVARHNFTDIGAIVTVRGEVSAGVFETLAEARLDGNRVALFRFLRRQFISIQVIISGASAPPALAVLYVGRVLTLQRRIYVGHTPLRFGRQADVVTGRNMAGDFIGRIVLGNSRQSAFSLQNLTPDWVRSELDPFLENAQVAPFFFSWRPSGYAREVGYAWLTNDPQPQNQLANGMMSVEFELGGVVT